MLRHVFLLSVMAPVSAVSWKLQTNLTCSSSSDPAAVNATQLHSNHDDQGFLWVKDPDSAPLPQCSSSSFSPPASRCEVCRLGQVFIICADLPDGAALYLERPGDPYWTQRTACPEPPAAAELYTVPDEPRLPPAAPYLCSPVARCSADQSDENTRNHFAAVVSLILFLLLILTAAGLCRAHGLQQDGSGGIAEPSHNLEVVLSNQCGTENRELNVSNGP